MSKTQSFGFPTEQFPTVQCRFEGDLQQKCSVGISCDRDQETHFPVNITCDQETNYPVYISSDRETYCPVDYTCDHEPMSANRGIRNRRSLQPLALPLRSSISSPRSIPTYSSPRPVPPPSPPCSVPLPVHKDSRTINVVINEETIQLNSDDFESISVLSRGTFSYTELVRHRGSELTLAVKRIHAKIKSEFQRRLLTNMDEIIRLKRSPFLVQLYGVIFLPDNVLICMEVMTTSVDKINQAASTMDMCIPEPMLSRIASSVLQAMDFLQQALLLTRYDVEPSNILINSKGDVKMCDFGMSRHLVDPLLAMVPLNNWRCYIGPERIDGTSAAGWGFRSSVWSIGITMFELSTGGFPFAGATSVFQILEKLVQDPAPRLPSGQFSTELESFVEICLQKDYTSRPTCSQLMEHSFITKHSSMTIDLDWLNQILIAIAILAE